MDWIVWLVVIIVVVAVIWWLLNRNKSRPGADSASAAGTSSTSSGTSTSPTAGPTAAAGTAASSAAAGAGSAAAMAAPAAAPAPEPAAPARETAAAPEAPEPTAAPEAAGTSGNAEWETQWSETAPPTDTHAAPAHVDPTRGAHVAAAEPGAAAEPAATEPAAAAGHPVHHPEYTEPHAPTLPGAESAAAEPVENEESGTGTGTGTTIPQAPTPGAAQPASLSDAETAQPSSLADTETTQTAASSAEAGAFASHTAEPTGHLATDQPYGEGSAAPAADGSGPVGFTVKGNASSMIYHDESSPAYEETRAEVWFLSAAHAEAAGFRPPRRTRQ